jgi:general secretion pathway protein I
MVAVALFGAVVTVIVSAQAGLVASNKAAANLSQAIEVGRCRMSELEEKELKLGFPQIEEKDTNTVCCDEKEVPGFSCEWQIDRVTLPQATNLAGEGGLNSILGGGLGLDAGFASFGSAASSALASPLGTVMSNPLGGAQLDFEGGLQNMGQSLSQSFGQSLGGGGGAGMSGLLTLVFSLVYPSLKPLLETAVRRITVVIKWNEGHNPRDFTLVQYVTNPSQVSLLAALADSGAFGEGGAPVNVGGAGAANPANPGLGK